MRVWLLMVFRIHRRSLGLSGAAVVVALASAQACSSEVETSSATNGAGGAGAASTSGQGGAVASPSSVGTGGAPAGSGGAGGAGGGFDCLELQVDMTFTDPCEFDLPMQPPGQSWEQVGLVLAYTPTMNPQRLMVPVDSALQCAAGDYYFEPPVHVVLCPAFCTTFTQDPGGAIDVCSPMTSP